jgi:small-conductance mechanosensitive channel
MTKLIDHALQHWMEWTVPLAAFLGTLLAGWFGRRLLFDRLKSLAAKSKGHLDDLAIDALRGPFLLWVLILAIHAATLTAGIPERHSQWIGRTLLILWILSLTITAARFAGSLVKYYGGNLESTLPVTTLTQSLVKLGVSIAGILVLLDTLHISVAPILTALGVGGIAVALALQDTLSNLFAGFYVSIAGQVRVGDYIRLETGNEGYVVDISWRSTTLRALPNNMIVVPNSKLAQVIVTNYNLPEKRMGFGIPVSVSYDSDIDQVERVLLEVARESAAEIPGLLADPAPSVRFIPGFGPSSLDFTLGFQVAEFVDQYAVQSELRKRIFRRFRQEGIEIPHAVPPLRQQGSPPPA